MSVLFKNTPIEVVFTAAMMVAMLLLSKIFQLPILLPTGPCVAFLGIHYLVPLVAAIGCALWTILAQRSARIRTFAIALPCYAIVVLVHFNIKLWAPHINPATYDALFWQMDQAVWPLIIACIKIRQHIALILPYEANLYMLGFMFLFYVSFCYHAT